MELTKKDNRKTTKPHKRQNRTNDKTAQNDKDKHPSDGRRLVGF